jgi:glyoxylate/hydroxypyruvate reductase
MTTATLIAVTGSSAPGWYEEFRRQAAARALRFWPDSVGDPQEIAYVCAWRAPHGLFAQFPNLRVIFNLGAGADHHLADPQLPDVPLVRVVDPDLTMRMVEYVVLHVLLHHRRQRVYDRQQRERVWLSHPQPAASEVTVGIMGLGEIGRETAAVLRRIGFQVRGWSRTEKAVPGIEGFAGPTRLSPFLTGTDILVCLLPHTPETEGILGLKLFRQLRRDGPLGGAYLVNAGRGRLQLDEDIMAALRDGSLAGASLDVFPVEPLPPESALWGDPRVTITPHNAGDLEPRALIPHILEQIAAHQRGLPLRHVIERTRGY